MRNLTVIVVVPNGSLCERLARILVEPLAVFNKIAVGGGWFEL
jgi:hypothetical protein